MLGISTLSNKINGLLDPLIDPICPRILIVGSDPTSPLGIVTLKPGVLPCIARPASAIGRPCIVSLIFIEATAPVKLPFFCVP
ncbi:hypothetical protein D3C81_1440400 [compost metagenome]